MNHHTTKNTSESRYRYLHPAKSNSIVLLPIVSFSFPALLSFNLYIFPPLCSLLSDILHIFFFFLIPFQVDSFALPYFTTTHYSANRLVQNHPTSYCYGHYTHSRWITKILFTSPKLEKHLSYFLFFIFQI